jgi:hypothetical protein
LHLVKIDLTGGEWRVDLGGIHGHTARFIKIIKTVSLKTDFARNSESETLAYLNFHMILLSGVIEGKSDASLGQFIPIQTTWRLLSIPRIPELA